MRCERCGKNLGEFLCSACKRVVCSDCKTLVDSKIFCLDHSNIKVEKPKKDFKILKTAIKSTAITLGGMILIFFITNNYIAKMKLPIEVPYVTKMVELFVTFGIRLIEVVAFILIILVIALFAGRKFHKRQNI